MPNTDRDFEECVDRIRKALSHAVHDDDIQRIEVDLQHAVAALGISPIHIYPNDESGPDSWADPDLWPDDPMLNEENNDDADK